MGGQEEIYDNSEESMILFKCRTNNMNLGNRKRFKNEPTACIMCADEKEELTHFPLKCVTYREERTKNLMLQQPYIQNEDNLIGRFLFENQSNEINKITIYKFWQERETKIKNIV